MIVTRLLVLWWTLVVAACGGTGALPARDGTALPPGHGAPVRESERAARGRASRDATSRDGVPAPATGSRGFRSERQFREHFAKHGREFGRVSPEEYLARAQALRDAPAGGDILERVRGDGVITRYDRAGRAFLAVNRDGTIRTFFRPSDGEAYFRRQATRDPR